MSKKAIISLAGKQFFVEEGQVLNIDKHLDKEGAKVTVGDVLLTVDGDKVEVGTPTVKGAEVVLEVITLKKGPKVVTARFMAKSRHRRVVGHRQPQTELKVTKIA